MAIAKDLRLNSLICGAYGVGIVAHDAGGANILNALIKRFNNINFYLLIDGPAVKIFDSNNVHFVDDESVFFERVNFVLLGTGSTSFEKRALRRAKEIGCETAVLLDHFVNFKSRFIYENQIIFPDHCFVCDEYSYEIAKRELAPYKSIYVCENYLVSNMRLEIGSADIHENNNVLYVLENINENWDEKLLPWEVAFKNFYNNFYLHKNFNSIIARPHPKDDPEIYRNLNSYDEVIFDYDSSPIGSLKTVSTVVGVESYLLNLAHHCGYGVYTSLPADIRPPRLPKNVYKVFDS